MRLKDIPNLHRRRVPTVYVHWPKKHIDGTDGIDYEYNNIGEKAIS
jgi:hypothetical protein